MKQILFNTEMVRAILDDRKTQTRRPIKAPGNEYHYDRLLGDWGLSREPEIIKIKREHCLPTKFNKDKYTLAWELQTEVDGSAIFYGRLPYQPGETLYVRETWKIEEFNCSSMEMEINYEADEIWESIEFSSGRFEKFKKYYDKNGWQPNIFMPKEAARIFLNVTDVRVERIQDITEKDAIAEGTGHGFQMNAGWPDYQHINKQGVCELTQDTARMSFLTLWDFINAKKGYGWDNSPWVWVIEFERTEID